MKFTLVEQKISPRYDNKNGIDYSKPGKILIIKGSLLLVWQPGSTYWSGMYGNNYNPSSLQVRDLAEYRRNSEIIESGRLSKKKILHHSEKINEFFGEDIASKIDIKRTLIIEE